VQRGRGKDLEVASDGKLSFLGLTKNRREGRGASGSSKRTGVGGDGAHREDTAEKVSD